MRDPELLARARHMRANPTPAESRLWYHLRAHRFESLKFRHQTVLGRYIVDFTSRTAMLAIEVDGDTHATQQDYDATRSRYLEAAGFHVLRFANCEVMNNIEGVLQIIGNALNLPLSACGESEQKANLPLPSGERAGERGMSRAPRLTTDSSRRAPSPASPPPRNRPAAVR